MATKAKSVFVCNACGAQAAKWAGQCPACGAWNTLSETLVVDLASTRSGRLRGPAATAQPLNAIKPERISRIGTGMTEVDHVLGGGLVMGSVVLIGGDPGIGKSTLLLQVLAEIGRHVPVLYASGEESTDQIALRARRLGVESASLHVLAENQVERILRAADSTRPQVIVVDSVQTVFTELMQSAPGSVAQVRESAAQLTRYAKTTGTAIFLVGHVTKEGALAGPRVLEHMVDAVLYFEGDASTSFRIIRGVKNRFGPVNEIGVFVMIDTGLREVGNPSAMFLSRQGDAVPGSVVFATQEGTRPLLVEVQALVDQSYLMNPRRVCVGLDANRLALLLAVLHRHAGIAIHDQDVFVNIVGGVRVTETAADLPTVLAVASSLRNRPLGKDLVIFGEIGLSGEVRPVQRGQERVREAARLGFARALIPAANAPKKEESDIRLFPVRRLEEALDLMLS